jgi:hypothetical protein
MQNPVLWCAALAVVDSEGQGGVCVCRWKYATRQPSRLKVKDPNRNSYACLIRVLKKYKNNKNNKVLLFLFHPFWCVQVGENATRAATVRELREQANQHVIVLAARKVGFS